MNYKLIIFDWDGTLADSTGRIIDSMQCASREVGLPEVTDTSVRRIIGLGLPQALQNLWPDINQQLQQQMTEAYARYFIADSQVDMGFYPGVEQLLPKLRSSGYLLAVATGKSRRGLDRMLDTMLVSGKPARSQFDASRCADETCSKPNPLMLKELLAELSVPVGESLMIGDTDYDLCMAQTIGMDSVGMTHGAHDESDLLACSPLALCNNIKELGNWIDGNG